MSHDWDLNWDENLYIPVFIKELSEIEAAYALREAWKKIYGVYPAKKSLALLLAQSALETGRWKVIRNNNFGNIKKKHYQKLSWTVIPDDGHKWTMFATGENLINKETKKVEWHWFEPPHIQTHFRSYDSVIDGAEDYIRLVSERKRYIKAWQEIINGDPYAYSHELREAGYYTASEKKYTAGVVRLFNEFIKKELDSTQLKPEETHIEPTKLVAQQNSEIVMEEIQILGYISPTKDIEIVENKNPTLAPKLKNKTQQTKASVNSGLAMIIAAGIATVYAWISGFFN